jgi:putative ABC transport system ATP-binding protein
VESGIYQFILRHSRRDQVALVLLSLVGLPILYYTFELPKLIINDAIANSETFPRLIFGVEMGQISYLALLSFTFLALVILSGAVKYITSTYRYRVGDRLLRRLRYDLVERLLRFPTKEFKTQSSGQVVSMVAAETAPLGFFMSEALTVPTVAFGTLFTVLLFIFVQDWMMGVAALALYPLQLYIIPRIQAKLNDLERLRAIELRHVSDNVEHIVVTATEIHAHDTARLELARVGKRLQTIFDIRVRIATLRYTINVLNQFFSQLTPFFFLLIGGYLVIQGDITLGALVAVLAAHKDMYAPWKDLIDYYQKAADSRVKYDQLREFFCPASLLEKSVIAGAPTSITLNTRDLVMTDVMVDAGDGVRPLDGANLTLTLPTHVLFVAGTGTGRDEIARILQRQTPPTSGNIRLGSVDVTTLTDHTLSRTLAYAGPDTVLGSGSLLNCLLYPLHRQAVHKLSDRHAAREATITGNSELDPDSDWIDYEGVGCGSPNELNAHIDATLHVAGLETETFDWGLHSSARQLDGQAQSSLLRARALTAQALIETRLDAAVEPFDSDQFLENGTILENIVFGSICDGSHQSVTEVEQHALQAVEASGCGDQYFQIGIQIAALMVEMFQDVDRGDDFFQGYNFIPVEEMPIYEALVRKFNSGPISTVDGMSRRKMQRITLNIISAKHSFGLLDTTFKEKTLLVRRSFRETIPAHLHRYIRFFDSNTINPELSIRENLIHGKFLDSKADYRDRVDTLLKNVAHESGLSQRIRQAGLSYDIGVRGARLSSSQRQRVAIARALIKKPNILILKDAFSAIEGSRREAIFEKIKTHMAARSLIVIESDDSRRTAFSEVYELSQGHLRQQAGGPPPAATSEVSGSNTTRLSTTAETLASIPLFAAIDQAKLKLLTFTSNQVTYDSGQYVFRQGDFGDNAYVVLEGEVEVVLELPTGEKPLARLGKNQVFGEMALLASQPRSTSIRCAVDTRLLAIRQDVFIRLVKEDSAIALSICRLLIDRLSKTLRDVSAK